MPLEDFMLSERNQSPPFPLYEVSKIAKLTEAENTLGVAGGGGQRTERCQSIGRKFPLQKPNKFQRSAVQHCALKHPLRGYISR